MDTVAYNGLLESIQHWKENEAAENFDQASVSSIDCALCQLYAKNWCIGCPVSEATGETECASTPYDAAYDAFSRRDWEEFQVAAKSERILLQALVPAGGPQDA